MGQKVTNITFRVSQIKKFSGGACPQSPLECCGCWSQLWYNKLPPVSENLSYTPGLLNKVHGALISESDGQALMRQLLSLIKLTPI